MALRIPVQKDIGEYEEKIVGKMSLRTLACVSLGFGSAVGAAAFVHLGLHADVADAAFPIMLCSMPFWLAGFWRPFGMRAEKFAAPSDQPPPERPEAPLREPGRQVPPAHRGGKAHAQGEEDRKTKRSRGQ